MSDANAKKIRRMSRKFPHMHMIGKLQTAVEIIEEAMDEDEFELLPNDIKAAVNHAHSMTFRACNWVMQERIK